MLQVNTHYNTLECDPNQVLKSLGWGGQTVSQELLAKTKEAVKIALEKARPKTILLSEDLSWNGGLFFCGVELEGEAIKEFLVESNKAALIAATLGIGLDRKIKQLEKTDLTMALLVDAAASLIIEDVLDRFCADFEKKMHDEGKFITERFSPGYSDLPLELQPKLLDLLDAPRKLGLTVSDSYLLFPRKSVTAFIGIMDKPREIKSSRCERCRLKGKCKYGICKIENKG